MATSDKNDAPTSPKVTSEPRPERDMPTKIRDWLQRHGYPLEMRTAKAFQCAEYLVGQSMYFENGAGVQQEIDVIASKQALWDEPRGGGAAQVMVVAECKANPKNQLPWVVFTADAHPYMNQVIGEYSLFSDVATIAYKLEAPAMPKPELLTFGARLGHGIQCAQIYDGKANEDLAYESILKLTHAALSRLQRDADGANVVLPVLVVGTPVYECWLDDAASLQLEERKHIVLAWHRSTQVKATVPFMAVHVVHESGLGEFIQKVDQLFNFFSTSIRAQVSTAFAILVGRRREEEERQRRERALAQMMGNSSIVPA